MAKKKRKKEDNEVRFKNMKTPLYQKLSDLAIQESRTIPSMARYLLEKTLKQQP